MDLSLCEYFYEPDGVDGHKCGYCKTSDGSTSQGMWTHRLKCQDYQDLIDRGWRRSGKYCYKPIMDKTCCPLYCIRCDVREFKLSHSQKAVLKKMNGFLSGSEKEKIPKQAGPATAEGSTATAKVSTVTKATKKAVKPGAGPDPTKATCKKSKVIRREFKETKAASRVSEGDTKAQQTEDKTEESSGHVTDIFKVDADGRKPIEMFINPSESTTASASGHKLEMKLIQSNPPSPEFKATYKTSYQLFRKYQMSVHQEKEEDCTEKGFQRFLCDSPLAHEAGPSGWPCGYGSYHQHYLLDGKLIAVGVVDVLPKCVSSVYLFYDVDYNFLSLGVYSALREIAMTRSLHVHSPDSLQYYYMGYYVHSCVKMRYKGQYSPSFLLCPEEYKFVPIEQCIPKLDSRKYSLLCDEGSSDPVSSDLGSVHVLFGGAHLFYKVVKSIVGGKDDVKVKEWMKFVGPEVAKRMILVI